MSWAEVPSSKLKDASLWCGNPGAPAPPNCLPTSFTGGGNNIRDAVIGGAWGSGDYDPVNDELVFPRLGGHADWAGNQVIALTGSNTWLLKKNASTAYPHMGGTDPFLYKYSDGSPSSVHSYDGVCYMPSKAKFWLGGGIYWSPGGESSPEKAWWWDPAAATFAEKATRLGGYGISSGWDPVTNCIYYIYSNGFAKYDPTLEDGGPNTAAYTSLFAQSHGAIYSSPLAIDSVARKCYRIDYNVGLKMVDLNNLGAKEVKLTTTGNTTIETYQSTGLLYRDGRLVGLGPSSVANRWAVYTAIVADRGGAGQPAVQWVRDPVDANEPVSTGTHGIWKRFAGPFLDGKYRVVNMYDMNVFEYTPSWTSTTHTVDEVTDLNVEVLA